MTDGQTVIGWFGTGQVVALDAATGQPLWSKHLGQEYGVFDINWGHSSSPVLHADVAIFPCYHEGGSYLLALDKKSGAPRWKRDRQPSAHSYSTPLVVTHGGQTTLVLNSSRGVEAFDPATGTPLWHVLEDNRFPIPMPVHHEGILYMSRGYRSTTAAEEYFCNFEVNPEYVPRFQAAGLRAVAWGPTGELRAVELPANRYFLATLFQPQLHSKQPHPVIVDYVRACSAVRRTSV